MTKAVSLSFGLLFLIATAPVLSAQQTSPAAEAVSQAVLDQANTIVLRQKIEEARSAQARGDIIEASKLYEEAYSLVQNIGSGIDTETAETISGLAATHLELARRAQRAGDYQEANDQVVRVLKVDPNNADAIAFKKQNDQLIASLRGKIPDASTMAEIPDIMNAKMQSATLVQDGKILYEAGKFDEAEVRFQQAMQLDPDNQSAIYYINLLKQAEFARQQQQSQNMFQDKMVQVEKAWNPKVGIGLPTPNPYFTNTDVHTGGGREDIYSKLDRIQMDSVSWPDGLPLSEVLRYLTEQSKLRDPDKIGINFIFNPNVESSSDNSALGAGLPGAPVPIGANGLPETSAAAPAETAVDPTAINIKLSLDHVRLQDLLDAIVMVSDHPIQYSVLDYAIVFSGKPTGPEPPTLEMRVFNVDPNTFYQGLQSVSAFVFGSANSSGSSGSGGSGGGSSGGGGGGSSGSSISGAVVPVTDMAPGGSAERQSSGGSGGGGGGGGGGAGAAQSGGGSLTGASAFGATAAAGNTGGANTVAGSVGNATVFASGGGVAYITQPGYMQNVSLAAEGFFRAIGVNLSLPGRSIAFNDRLGLLFVKATPEELDTIERAVQALNQVAPEVHIKARFIEVTENDNDALGFQWYLGNFINGTVVANGGTAPSLTVPVSSANPLGAFPGNTTASLIPGSSSDQLLTSGLSYVSSATPPTIATVTGILTDPNFRVALQALEQRGGAQSLAEPDIVTTSGRQTQMRATDIEYILTGYSFQAGNTGVGTGTGVP